MGARFSAAAAAATTTQTESDGDRNGQLPQHADGNADAHHSTRADSSPPMQRRRRRETTATTSEFPPRRSVRQRLSEESAAASATADPVELPAPAEPEATSAPPTTVAATAAPPTTEPATTPPSTIASTLRQSTILRQSLELILFHLVQEQQAMRSGPVGSSLDSRVDSFYYFGNFLARVGEHRRNGPRRSPRGNRGSDAPVMDEMDPEEDLPFLHVTPSSEESTAVDAPNGMDATSRDAAENAHNLTAAEPHETLTNSLTPEAFFARHMARPRTITRQWLQPARVVEVNVQHHVAEDDRSVVVEVPMMVLGVRGSNPAVSGESAHSAVGAAPSTTSSTRGARDSAHPAPGAAPTSGTSTAHQEPAAGQSTDDSSTNGWSMYVVGGRHTEDAIASIERHIEQATAALSPSSTATSPATTLATRIMGLQGRFIMSVSGMTATAANNSAAARDEFVIDVDSRPPQSAAERAYEELAEEYARDDMVPTMVRRSTRLRRRVSATAEGSSASSSAGRRGSPVAASVAEFLSDNRGAGSSPTATSAASTSSSGSPASANGSQLPRGPRAYVSPPAGGVTGINAILAAMLVSLADTDMIRRLSAAPGEQIEATGDGAAHHDDPMDEEQRNGAAVDNYDLFLRLAEFLGPARPRHADSAAVEQHSTLITYNALSRRRAHEASLHMTDNDDDTSAAMAIASRCPICLCEYDGEDELRELKCSHTFHKDCIDIWLCKHVKTCPLCRMDAVATESPATIDSSSSSPL